jgi:hypothetical protein
MPNLKLRFNSKKNPTGQPGGFDLNPTKTQGVGDVGWMVDCEIAEFFKLANLVSTTKYPFPLGLAGP